MSSTLTRASLVRSFARSLFRQVLNLRVTRLRGRLLKTKRARLLEPCVLIVVFTTLGTILPLFFPCLPTQCVIIQGESKPVCPEGTPPRIQRWVLTSTDVRSHAPTLSLALRATRYAR